jgi:hypothetical protein
VSGDRRPVGPATRRRHGRVFAQMFPKQRGKIFLKPSRMWTFGEVPRRRQPARESERVLHAARSRPLLSATWSGVQAPNRPDAERVAALLLVPQCDVDAPSRTASHAARRTRSVPAETFF